MMKESDLEVREDESIDDSVGRLHSAIQHTTELSFPWENYKIRSTDDPWIDSPMRKKIKQRKAMFARDKCRSRDWRQLKALTNKMIKTRKKAFFDKECAKL